MIDLGVVLFALAAIFGVLCFAAALAAGDPVAPTPPPRVCQPWTPRRHYPYLVPGAYARHAPRQ